MVAMNVWPTDAADGSVSSEARWRKMARLWAASGIADKIGSEMAPTLAFPNLTIKNGAAWVDGAYTELPGDQVLAVTANGLTVVRFDPAANTADLLYRDGITVPAQDPNGTWELPIAQMVGSALVDKRVFASRSPGQPWGVIGYAEVTSSLNGIGTTQTPVVGMPATRLQTGRRYRIDANIIIFAPNANFAFYCQIWDQISGAQLNATNYTLAVGGFQPCQVWHHLIGAGQMIQPQLRVWTSTSTVNTSPNPTAPAQLVLADVGPV